MSGGWKQCKWGDLATLQYGRALKDYSSGTGSFRVFGTNGPIGYHETALTPDKTVVIGRKGAYRGVHLSPDPCWVIDTAFFLVPTQEMDMRWAYYQLLTQNINKLDSGSAIPSTSRADFYSLNVLVPPVEEQKGIADALAALDRRIDLNRQMNRTLDDLAAALFRAWFVDFKPVRAKIEGRAPVGIDAETAALFPDRLVESEIGEIPEGWRVASVSDFAEVNGWTLRKSDELEVIDYVEISEVMRGDIDSVSTYQRGQEPSRARRRLRHGDTAMSTVRPDRGAYFLAIEPKLSLIASTGFAVVTPTGLPWGLIHCALTQPEVFTRLGQLADGSAYPAVAPEAIGETQIAVPSDPRVADCFQAVVESLFTKMQANREQNRTLAELRDLLLPRLMSGELRVGDAEAMIP